VCNREVKFLVNKQQGVKRRGIRDGRGEAEVLREGKRGGGKGMEG